MFTPEDIQKAIEPIANIYRALEDEIFLKVARRLKNKSPEYWENADRDLVLQWQAEKMAQLRMLNNEVLKELSKVTGMAKKEIKRIIEEVGLQTVLDVDEELSKHSKTLPVPNDLDFVLATYTRQVFRELDNYVNQTLITTNFGEGTVSKMYRNIIEETTGKVLGGVQSVNQAVLETVIRWADKGLDSGFVDRAGRTWSVERYAETVIRSTVNRTYNELRISRMNDYDIHTVLISSLSDPREVCSKIQGKVATTLKPDQNNTKYPSIYEYGYGEPWGLRGVNCRHMFFPFIEGVNINNQPQYSEETMKRNRELRQRQRYYERQIRKAKRSLTLAEELGDKKAVERYKRLVRDRQTRIREFTREHGLKRFYDRERLILVNK